MKPHKLPAKKTLWLILLSILTISAALILLKNAGTNLIRTDNPTKPTPTIILMGSIADRVLETNDIYKAGLTDTIIIANSNQSGGEALLQYGITIPNNTALSAQILKQLGIPDSSIFILPGKTKSTRDEADTLISWIKTNNIRLHAITIVSSSAHMRRANMVFNDAFNDNNLNIKIYTIPSKYSDFNPKHWYTHRESAKQVFMEYIKMISFLLVEQWQ